MIDQTLTPEQLAAQQARRQIELEATFNARPPAPTPTPIGKTEKFKWDVDDLKKREERRALWKTRINQYNPNAPFGGPQ